MCEQLSLPICQSANVTVSDFHAKVSALLESEKDSEILEELYFLKSCGLLKSESLKYYSQKMLADCLTMMGGATFGTIINTMAELGYLVEWQVLDSQYYVPQHRERVFIVGHLGNGCGRKVFPITENDRKVDELQRHTVTNTVTSRYGNADSTGTYIATDRQTDRSAF